MRSLPISPVCAQGGGGSTKSAAVWMGWWWALGGVVDTYAPWASCSIYLMAVSATWEAWGAGLGAGGFLARCGSVLGPRWLSARRRRFLGLVQASLSGRS